jgi:hypothetical protein
MASSYKGLENEFVMFTQQTTGLTAYLSPPLTVVYWKSNRELALNTAFQSLSNGNYLETSGPQDDVATREVEFDVHRFISKYFLNNAGERCRMKTTTPIILGPSISKKRQLCKAAGNVRKLRVFETENFYLHKCLAIGWGRRRTKACLKPIDDKIKKLKQEVEEERKMEHGEKERLSGSRARCGQTEAPRQSTLKLADLTGTYCLKTTSRHAEGYHNDSDKLSMSIGSPESTDGCLTAFKLQMVSDTMLIALSEDKLHAFAKQMEASESEDEEVSDEEVYYRYGPPTKRKATAEVSQQPPIRRKLSKAPRPGRFYFKWAGREAGEGEVELDDNGG